MAVSEVAANIPEGVKQFIAPLRYTANIPGTATAPLPHSSMPLPPIPFKLMQLVLGQ